MGKHFYQYPAVVVTSSEVATAPNNGALPGLLKVIAGYDGSNVKVIATDSAGRILTSNSSFIVKEFSLSNLFSTPAPTATYLQILASSASDVFELYLNNTSGSPIEIATGAALSEVPYCVVGPGEKIKVPCSFVSGTRFSAKSLASSAADDGLLIVHYMGV